MQGASEKINDRKHNRHGKRLMIISLVKLTESFSHSRRKILSYCYAGGIMAAVHAATLVYLGDG